ncbi:hypothetical protein D3C75_1267540 [compost metagenome]
MPHHRIAEIPGARISLFDLTNHLENMAALLRRTDIAAQHRIAVFQLVDGRNPLNDLRQVAGRHHAARPFPVLGMI